MSAAPAILLCVWAQRVLLVGLLRTLRARRVFVSVFFRVGAISDRSVCEVVASVELYCYVSHMPCCSCPFALEDLRFQLVALNSRPVSVTYSGAAIVQFELVVA